MEPGLRRFISPYTWERTWVPLKEGRAWPPSLSQSVWSSSKPRPITVELRRGHHPPQALPLRLSQSPSVPQSLRPSGKSWLLTRLLGSVTLTSSQPRAGSPISAPICCALPPLLRREVPQLLRREPRFLRETWQREVSGQKAATTAGLVTVAATIHCCPPPLSILSSPRPQPAPLLASVA